jgi:hypothetical protein
MAFLLGLRRHAGQNPLLTHWQAHIGPEAAAAAGPKSDRGSCFASKLALRGRQGSGGPFEQIPQQAWGRSLDRLGVGPSTSSGQAHSGEGAAEPRAIRASTSATIESSDRWIVAGGSKSISSSGRWAITPVTSHLLGDSGQPDHCQGRAGP